MKFGAGPLVIVQFPLPWENAIGIVAHPGVCRTNAMSVNPLPLKSPARTFTPGALAQSVMKFGAAPLVIVQFPLPCENATGMVAHPGVWRTRAMSPPWTVSASGALQWKKNASIDGATGVTLSMLSNVFVV